MIRVAVAQLGARRHYAIPSLLHDAGLLERLYTDLCASAGWPGWLSRLLPGPLRRGPLRRVFGREVTGVPARRIVSRPGYGVRRVLRRRRASSPGAVIHGHLRANVEFCRQLVQHGLGRATVVYAFNGAALELLRHARRCALPVILEQTRAPIAVEERLIAQERTRWPDWEVGQTAPSAWRAMAEREAAEWALADTILCGSQHVIDGMAALEAPVERCRLMPYGIDTRRLPVLPRRRPGGPLRVLFVGTLCLRKGIPYVMQTARALDRQRFVFRAVGPSQLTPAAQGQLADVLELTGAVPRPVMIEQYRWADVLLFPSISEGSSNVTYEAMACGLPVITTANSGSVVRDGQEGRVIPIRAPEAMAAALEELAGDTAGRAAMSAAARRRAEAYDWSGYQGRLVDAVRTTVRRGAA